MYNKVIIDRSQLDINDYFKPKLKTFNPGSDLVASYSEQKSRNTTLLLLQHRLL